MALADYSLIYTFHYYDLGGHLHLINISQRNYSGSSTTLSVADDENPVTLKHIGNQDQFINDQEIIKGQGLEFKFYVSQVDAEAIEALFELEYKDVLVEYDLDSDVEFIGYLKPETYSKTFFNEEPSVQFTLTATDGLADLKNIEFRDSTGAIINGTFSLLELLKFALIPLDLDLDFIIQLNTYHSNMSDTECCLEKTSIDSRRFIEDGKVSSCGDVIETILGNFNVTFKQNEGYWRITNAHEFVSYKFRFDYTTLTQVSRVIANNWLNISNYKFKIGSEKTKIRPLKTVLLTFKNKDLGGDISSLDLTDWNTIWDVQADGGYTILESGTVCQLATAYSLSAYSYLVLASDFSVSKFTDNDYIKVTLDTKVFLLLTTGGLNSTMMKIEVKNPQGDWSAPVYFAQVNTWQHYESPINAAFKITQTGYYNVRITFVPQTYPAPIYWTAAAFWIKNITITKVVSADNTEQIDVVTLDTALRQTSDKGFDTFERDVLLGDSQNITEVGAFLWYDSEFHNTKIWTNVYGDVPQYDGFEILDIYCRNILNNRHIFKNSVRLSIIDPDNTIRLNNSLYYVDDAGAHYFWIMSFTKYTRQGIIDLEVVEFVDGQNYITYSPIWRGSINSSNGQALYSISGNTSSNGGGVTYHNDLLGKQGGAAGEYYHLTNTDYTNVGNLDSMAYESTTNYYTISELQTSGQAVVHWNNISNVELGNDILEFSTNKYTPYTSKQTGINLYTGTTNPDGSTRLNLNADLYATVFHVTDGNNLNYISNTAIATTNPSAGSSANLASSGVLSINRGTVGGGVSLITLTDPGTSSKYFLDVNIATVNKIRFHPMVASGGTAYYFSTVNSLTSGSLFNISNNGTSIFDLGFDNTISTDNSLMYLNMSGQLIVGSSHSSNNRTAILGQSYSNYGILGISETGFAVYGLANTGVGGRFDSDGGNALEAYSNSDLGALIATVSHPYIASFGEQASDYIEKSRITLAGKYEFTPGIQSDIYAVAGGIIKTFATEAETGSSTAEVDLHSWDIPAYVLVNDGDVIRFTTAIMFNTVNGGTNYFRFYFNGSTHGNIFGFTNNGGNNYAYLTTAIMNVMRTSSSTAIASCTLVGYDNAAIWAKGSGMNITSIDFTSVITIKTTGQCQYGTTSYDNNAIKAKWGYIEYFPAGLN